MPASRVYIKPPTPPLQNFVLPIATNSIEWDDASISSRAFRTIPVDTIIWVFRGVGFNLVVCGAREARGAIGFELFALYTMCMRMFVYLYLCVPNRAKTY